MTAIAAGGRPDESAKIVSENRGISLILSAPIMSVLSPFRSRRSTCELRHTLQQTPFRNSSFEPGSRAVTRAPKLATVALARFQTESYADHYNYPISKNQEAVMAKKARRKSAAKSKKTKRAKVSTKGRKKLAAKSKSKQTAKRTAKRATKRAAKPASKRASARKSPAKVAPPTITEKVTGAFQTVVETVKETNELRDKLEPPGVSESA